MRALFLLIPALLLLAVPATASDILVVQGLRSALYDDTLKGFKSACPASARTLVLSDYANSDLERVIHEERPRVIVAMGDGALSSLHKIRKTPVLAVMAFGFPTSESLPANLTGTDLFVKPEQYLSLFKKAGFKRIGVVHDPARTGWYLKQARAAARQHGLELVVREASNPRQVVGQLTSLKGEIDALWLLPDLTVVTPLTLEAFFLYSQEELIPVVSFSAAHLKLGALMALDIDRVDLGRQAGEMAQQVLAGARPNRIAVAPPRKVSLQVNEGIAKRLNLPGKLIQSLSDR